MWRKVEFESTTWSGRNNEVERKRVSGFLSEKLHEGAALEATDFLVIGHSHAGNIATDAARTILNFDPKFPLIGTICLNTPFLTTEVRGSGAYLSLWLTVALLLSLSLLAGFKYWVAWRMLAIAGITIPEPIMLVALLAIAVCGLAWLMARHKRMKWTRMSAPKIQPPRPRVLCLSCPDDEAITALGLIEGLANLPQILLHPFAIFVALVGVLVAMFFGPVKELTDVVALGVALLQVAAFVTGAWIVFAVLTAVLASISVVLCFGMPLKTALDNLISRVLVSYIPLGPANADFRGLYDIRSSWWPRLYHSDIYRSEQTFYEIGEWLRQFKTAPRSGSPTPQPAPTSGVPRVQPAKPAPAVPTVEAATRSPNPPDVDSD
jgi:hypothetical protein